MTRLCLLFALCFILPAHAELADRDKPITLDADRISIDDLKRIQVFEGNVVLTQGTLMIRSDKIVVTEDAQGFQKGVAFAGPDGLARFRQKREGREDWIEGEAERIEYDTHHEIAELFQRAWVQSGSDQLRGDYIWYDGISERYLASSDPASASASSTSAPPSRVRATIQPKPKPDGAASAPSTPSEQNEENLTLKNATQMADPAHP